MNKLIKHFEERQCYSGIASALAQFHIPFMEEEEEDDDDGQQINEENEEDEKKELKMQRRRAQRALRALIFPAMRNRFLPAEDLRQYCQMLTSTAQAFKHFGRC